MVFAKAGFEHSIVHVGTSAVAERTWHVIHSDRGPLLFGCWYRPPHHAEVATIESIDSEVAEFGAGTLGTILVGDMNVHEERWLRHSDGTSPEGRLLRDISCSHGWEERVRKPTRGQYLLDLVLTDLGTEVQTKVMKSISDHEAVLGTLEFSAPESASTTRRVYDFGKVSWAALAAKFCDIDWDSKFSGLPTDTVAKAFTETIVKVLDETVPVKEIVTRSSVHPWLNDRCRHAIDARIEAQGTDQEIPARDECSRILLEEHDRYVNKVRRKLAELPSSSRGWWRLAHNLAGKRTKSSGVQSLKSREGVWARSAVDKAELLAETFTKKSELPESEVNGYSPLRAPCFASDSFLPVRTRDVAKILKKLKADSSTGPDGIASRVLKHCASGLSYPLTLLIRRMLSECRWPDVWREHWVVPLFKKRSRADPENYRGIHLTSQMSKATERVVGRFFQRHVEASGAFGSRQFAYTSGRSHRDALALSVLAWLHALEHGNLVALYCSDVSGAFDRVCSTRIAGKLASLHLHPRIFGILQSWLEPRVSKVVVEGCSSQWAALKNSVYQGTVLGAPLWNCFFADATEAVQKKGFEEVVFADDLNCCKILPTECSNEDALKEVKACQEELHKWGRANKVIFDSGKESLHLLHRTRGHGGNFTILGVEFDTGLYMHCACHNIATEAGWRLKTLLRTRRFHTTAEMVKLYKSQILTFIESRTEGIHHAAPSVLQCVDRVRRRFLREMRISEFDALMCWKLAPLQCRRAIAMLGLLYKVATGKAPPPLQDLFTRVDKAPNTSCTRTAIRRHKLQFSEFGSIGGHTETFRRSCFGLVTVWNMLPPSAVHCGSIKLFQRKLQAAVVSRAQSYGDFALFFDDARRMTVKTFQSHFP